MMKMVIVKTENYSEREELWAEVEKPWLLCFFAETAKISKERWEEKRKESRKRRELVSSC